MAALGDIDWDALSVAELLEGLDRLETVRRKATACAYDAAAAVDRRGREALGAIPHRVVADVVRVNPGEAKRRIRMAGQLCPRRTLTGQPVPPVLPATAKAWHAGALDAEHLRVIDTFFADLPDHVAPTDGVKAEVFLAEQARLLRPDQLGKLATRLALQLNPDGEFSDADRARKRGFVWCGGQGPDGMSTGKLIATPEMRAMVDALLAKLAAPGMCNPADQTPTVSGEPSQEVIDRDARSHAQRQHDALAAVIRSQLGDPRLGRHNGLPVTVIVSATLEQMHTGAGVAVTAGGTLLPMSDVIRMASHAWHYLCVYDQHAQRALYLGRAKRIASADHESCCTTGTAAAPPLAATFPDTSPRCTTSRNGPTAD